MRKKSISRLTAHGSRLTSTRDERVVPARTGTGEVRELASRFLAFAYPVANPDEAVEAVERLRRRYHDATHVAFAWKVGSGDAASRRASDAGEPSGTAGRPIASAIESAGVTDVLVAVVRYFGGTKLGTGGLSRAYREAACRAIAAAGRATRRETLLVLVTCPYEKLGRARRLVRPPEIRLAGEGFGEAPVLRLEVLRSRLPALVAALDRERLSYEVVPGG